ncbi:MAG: PHP domain-containing protein [Chloroflexi bacterium]|nr:PHP domain-containing protein [Chloroflexota bacterium]
MNVIGTYDLHSHTTFSDGTHDVRMMVRAAEAAQLHVYAITDHLMEGSRLWKSDAPIDALLAAVDEAQEETAITLLVGVEGTIEGPDGAVSVGRELAARLDLVLVDFGFRTAGVFADAPASKGRLIRNALDAVIHACQHPWVDVIAHPFNLGRCQPAVDLRELPASGLDEAAAAFAETGTIFEVMTQMYFWFPNMTVAALTDAYVDLVARFAAAGVRFSVGSDAHRTGSVGNLIWPRVVLERAGVPASQLIDPLRDLPLRHRHR